MANLGRDPRKSLRVKWYVDTCALLNLCATDRIEAIVADLGLTLRVVPKVYLEETLYLYGRIEDTRGERESLDLSPLLNKGVIHADDPLVDAELETFLAYAALMDDGEAETIAAAELRHGGVVTDELRAWRVLQDHAPQVSRITSLGLNSGAKRIR